MTEPPPFSYVYNLGRLGQAGDTLSFAADAAARAAIARWSDVLAVENFAVTARLKKTGATHYALEAELDADVVQACVVTLAPVPAHIARRFVRELHFVGTVRRGAPMEEGAAVILADGPDQPEILESLQYDLAAPALEEYSLALAPYPRAPGAEFAFPEGETSGRDNPFGVLKGLKNRR